MTTAQRNGSPPNVDRMPPANPDAEKAFLGSAMLNPAFADLLRPEEFHHDAHQRIHTVIVDLRERQLPVDPISIAEELCRCGLIDDVGGADYLTDLAHGVPHADHADYYADLIRKCAQRRQAVTRCYEIINAAHDPTVSEGDLAEIMAQPLFRECDSSRRPILPTSLNDLVSNHPRMAEPLIDGLLRRGETCNIIAASKVGKSWLAYGLALSIVTGSRWLGRYRCQRGRVLIIDNEVHPATIAKRIPTVAKAMHMQANDYSGGIDIVWLRGQLRTLYELDWLVNSVSDEYSAIILDAWYRMIPPGHSENDNAAMAQCYNRIDQYASQTGAAWILVHHSSKGGQAEKRITDVGAGAGSQSRASDTHLVLREHKEPGHIVLDAAVRSFPPFKPIVLRWEFPVWVPDVGMDPTAMKGRHTYSEQRQSERDREGMVTILAALAEGPATVRSIRGATGISKDRCERLLGLLKLSGKVGFRNAVVRGNETREYHVVGKRGRVVDHTTDHVADVGGGRSINRPTDHPPTLLADQVGSSTTSPDNAMEEVGQWGEI